MRDIIHLACNDCKNRNYTTKKNKRLHPERVEYRKYCPTCRLHKPHKETRWSLRDVIATWREKAGGRPRKRRYASSSIGRAADSKSAGWGVRVPPRVPPLAPVRAAAADRQRRSDGSGTQGQ